MINILSTNPVTTGWGWVNSFKQLSRVQSRQVGLLVGALVADAACRTVEGLPPSQLQQLLVAAQMPTSVGGARRGPSFLRPAGSLLFLRGSDPTASAHSLPGEVAAGTLRLMAAAKGGLVPIEEFRHHFHQLAVPPRSLPAAASAAVPLTQVPEVELAPEVPLGPLCGVLPLAATYPYCDDSALRSYVAPFVAHLMGLPESAMQRFCGEWNDGEDHQVVQEAAGDVAPLHGELLAAAATLSFFSVPIRCLQCNPSPVKNAAFRALAETQCMFPYSLQSVAAPDQRGLDPNSPSQRTFGSLRRVLEIIQTATSYQEGVEMCVEDALTEPEGETAASRSLCARAMLVGGCLGAKYGARQIPSEWIDATGDHTAACSLAVEVAQWAWNPA